MKRPKVTWTRCGHCRKPMKVVKGSVPARERLCNLCVIGALANGERTRVDLDAAC